MPGGKMFSPQLTVLVLGRLAVVAELGDLLFQASTIWTTQMSNSYGTLGTRISVFPRNGEKDFQLVLHVGVTIDC